MPPAITGPTPGIAAKASAPRIPPIAAPAAAPLAAPSPSLVPSASVIIPPAMTSVPRIAKPISSDLNPACSSSSTANWASSRSSNAVIRFGLQFMALLSIYLSPIQITPNRSAATIRRQNLPLRTTEQQAYFLNEGCKDSAIMAADDLGDSLQK